MVARVPAAPSGLVVLLMWAIGSVVFLIHPLPEKRDPDGALFGQEPGDEAASFSRHRCRSE